MTWVLLANFAATWTMVGMIWFAQVAHYPLYHCVGRETFVAYHRGHMVRTTAVVAVPVMVEAVTTVWLVVQPGRLPRPMVVSGAVLLLAVWLSTLLLQLPHYIALSRGYSEVHHRELVNTNTARTLAWTGRGALTLVMVFLLMR